MIGRYHAVDSDPPETYPHLPGQVGFPGGRLATADILRAAATVPPAGNAHSGERPIDRRNTAANVAGKSADSGRLTTDHTLYKAATSDEIKCGGKARRLGLVPVCELPIVTGLIPPEPLRSE